MDIPSENFLASMTVDSLILINSNNGLTDGRTYMKGRTKVSEEVASCLECILYNSTLCGMIGDLFIINMNGSGLYKG